MAKYLRRQEVEARYNVPTSTLYDWIAAGVFPAPIKIGTGHAARWLADELDEYDAQRINERNVAAVAMAKVR